MVKSCQFSLKIFSENEILTSIKGHNYFINDQNWIGNDLIQILSKKHAFITQPSIYGVTVYFCYVMSHWTIPPVNKYGYWLALYNGLVTWFPVKTHRCLSTCVTTMRVRFIYERRRYATMVKIRHGLATLNSNNSLVYGQRHKVCLIVFLVGTSWAFWDQYWADLVKLSVLQQNLIAYSNSMQETLLSISSNGLGYKTVISYLFVV